MGILYGFYCKDPLVEFSVLLLLVLLLLLSLVLLTLWSLNRCFYRFVVAVLPPKEYPTSIP